MSTNWFFRTLPFLSMITLLSPSLWSSDESEVPLLEVSVDNIAGLTLGHVSIEIEKSLVKKDAVNPDSKRLLELLCYIGLIPAIASVTGALATCPKYFTGVGLEGNAWEDDNYINMTAPAASPLINIICPSSLAILSTPFIFALVPILDYCYVKLQNKYADYKNYSQERWLNHLILSRNLATTLTENDMCIIEPILSNFPSLAKQLNLEQALILAEINAPTWENLIEDIANEDAKNYTRLFLQLLKMNPSELIEELRNSDEMLEQPSLWQALVRALPEDTLNYTANVESVASILQKVLAQSILPNGFIEDAVEIFNKIREKRDSINNILARARV